MTPPASLTKFRMRKQSSRLGKAAELAQQKQAFKTQFTVQMQISDARQSQQIKKESVKEREKPYFSHMFAIHSLEF